jgi:hypothetical protein
MSTDTLPTTERPFSPASSGPPRLNPRLLKIAKNAIGSSQRFSGYLIIMVSSLLFLRPGTLSFGLVGIGFVLVLLVWFNASICWAGRNYGQPVLGIGELC